MTTLSQTRTGESLEQKIRRPVPPKHEPPARPVPGVWLILAINGAQMESKWSTMSRSSWSSGSGMVQSWLIVGERLESGRWWAHQTGSDHWSELAVSTPESKSGGCLCLFAAFQGRPL